MIQIENRIKHREISLHVTLRLKRANETFMDQWNQE